jgi:hypothetical protein
LSASFDEKRRYFLQCLTDYLLQMSGSDLSKGLFYYTSKIFLDWVDQQKKNFDLSNKDSVIDAYRRYSKYLLIGLCLRILMKKVWLHIQQSNISVMQRS